MAIKPLLHAKALVALGAVCLLCSTPALPAHAYLSASDTASNRFSVSTCRVAVVEDFHVPETIEPNSTITKNVTFRNDGTINCYLRAYVDFADESTSRWASVQADSSAWTLAEDGYRYFSEPIGPAQLSEPICAGITIDDENPESGSIDSFDVMVYVEATPAKSPSGQAYASAQEAFAAISGGKTP